MGLLPTMCVSRRVEAAGAEAYARDEIGGIPPALATGGEAVSAGGGAALEPGDVVFTTHRGQAPQVARGLDPTRIMAELYGRRTGYNKGKSYHVTDVSRGVIGMGGIVAAQVPVAARMAPPPLAVAAAAPAAVARARAGGGTTLVEARTVRLGGHLAHDPQHYRSREEIAAAWEACPIKRFRARLAAAGLLTEEAYARMEAEVEADVAPAVEFARQSPFPESREAFEDLWA